jgi:hypothetical protein
VEALKSHSSSTASCPKINCVVCRDCNSPLGLPPVGAVRTSHLQYGRSQNGPLLYIEGVKVAGEGGIKATGISAVMTGPFAACEVAEGIFVGVIVSVAGQLIVTTRHEVECTI